MVSRINCTGSIFICATKLLIIVRHILLRTGSGGFGIGVEPTGIDGNELDAVSFFCMEGLITLMLGDGSYNNQNKI